MSTTAERILQGAAATVTERGIASTTVQHILDAAGVSRRTFYKHYQSKEDVLRALYLGYCDAMVEQVRADIEAAGSPIDKVRLTMSGYVDFVEQSGPVFWKLQAEAVGSDSLLAADREATLDRIAQLFDASAKEVLDVALDPLIYQGLLLALEGLTIRQRRAGGYTRERLVAVSVSMMLTLFAGAAGLPKAPAES